MTQPLLGSAPLPDQAAPRPVGLEANRATIVIQRLNADAAVWRFKAEVMAHVRSVEQQYWNLAQAHVQLWASDRAVSLAQEILNREQAELVVGRGTIADVAEAAQRLEQFNLDLVTRTSDVITTERQLRNILGLPPADNRRIIPVTPPTEARLEPDWESSLAQMLNFQPDIVQQQILVRVAELQLLIARNQLLPQLSLQALYQLNGLGQQLDSAEAVMTGATLKALNPVIANMQRAAGLNSQPGNYSNFVTVAGRLHLPGTPRHAGAAGQYPAGAVLPCCESRAYLQQVVHQTTHSLARFFLEIDANYKQFKTASRLRAAAALRLESQRAYYEEGRITIDRFLDAVSQYATAVATEAQYKTTYNISIVALEEAKGTLLAYDNIAVAEGPHPAQGLHPGPRHPGRPSPVLDRTRWSAGSPAASRPAQYRSRRQQPAAGRRSPRRPIAAARALRATRTTTLTACPRTPPCRITADPVADQPARPSGSARPAASAGAARSAADVRLTGGPQAAGAARSSASLIDPAVPGMGQSSVAESLGRPAPRTNPAGSQARSPARRRTARRRTAPAGPGAGSRRRRSRRR